jgi:hypothetical protein
MDSCLEGMHDDPALRQAIGGPHPMTSHIFVQQDQLERQP